MSTSQNSSSSAGNRPPPSDPKGVAKGRVGEADYNVEFYPGFASAISVNGSPLYRQAGTFILPEGDLQPWSSHAVKINCPTQGYSLVLNVEDPNYVIDRIEVTLRNPGGNGGGVKAHQAGTKVTVENAAMTCPPTC